MAKKRKVAKKRQEKKGPNWLIIGGVVLIGVVGLFALLFLESQPVGPQEVVALEDYCAENAERCVSIGDEDATVTLVEVSDFGCPHCQAFHREKANVIKEEYVDTDLVKWLFVPYALRPETEPAANAAMCAAEQGKFYEFTDTMFNQDTETSLRRDGFLVAAADNDLDIEPFQECLEEGRYLNSVSANQQAARAAGVSGTPTFFVNGQIVRGNVPLSEFANLFSQYLGS